MKEKISYKYGLLVALVMFVFLVLAVAGLVTGGIFYLLYSAGMLTAILSSRFPFGILLLMLVSILVGTALTALCGNLPLRSLRRVIDATQQIATGNFDVRLPVAGASEFRLLAENFNSMARELGSIETLRSDFVDNISHEFKTPVVSIKGFARLLKRDNLSPEKRDEYLDIIIAESERLTHLSSNMLLLSKLDGMEDIGERGAFPLDEQVRRAILLLEPQLSQKAIDLDIELEPVILTGSEELLHHVWLNLIGNAIKFTPSGGRVSVTLHRAGDTAVAEIRDSGAGMAPMEAAHIFDKFYQGDASRSTEGNGLGLSLVRRIVELSGGQVAVESAPGAGSCFTVRLPAR